LGQFAFKFDPEMEQHVFDSNRPMIFLFFWLKTKTVNLNILLNEIRSANLTETLSTDEQSEDQTLKELRDVAKQKNIRDKIKYIRIPQDS
jgi:hypothetical protein